MRSDPTVISIVELKSGFFTLRTELLREKALFCLADHRLSPDVRSGNVRSNRCAATFLPKAGNFRLFRIYGGLSLDGRVGVGDRSADVNASFSNILDHLHFTLMGMGDATWNNKIVLLTDALYSDLRGYHATPGPLFLGVNPNQKLFLLTPEGGYRILDERKGYLDIVGGIRYWHLTTDLQFQPGLLPGTEVQGTRGWVDGIFGLRGKVYLSDKWWATGVRRSGRRGLELHIPDYRKCRRGPP